MDYQEEALIDTLIAGGKLTKEQYDALKLESLTLGKTVMQLLQERRIIKDEDISRAKAKFLGIPYFADTRITVSPDLLSLINIDLAKSYQVMPLNLNKALGELTLIMAKPEDLTVVDFFQKRTGYKIKTLMTSKENLDNLINITYAQSLTGEISGVLRRGIETEEEGGVRLVTADTISQIIKEPKIVEIVRKVLEYAVRARASDIHIEPQENELLVRYRIDGILHDAMTLPKTAAASVTARIKVLSSMKLDEKRLPQDGRFKLDADGQKVSFRVSTLPTYFGEKTVMRLLREGGAGFTLEGLGFHGDGLEALHEAIKETTGLILTTGPTGSGKTTTLYTVLDLLNTPGVNISTIEDPVEYQMARVNQTQVRPDIGFTFANGLRTLVRQDPDIIMVGEIRDNETAGLAINAALTGHLVLSTLHTNSAAGAIPRLLDMQAEAFLLVSTLRVVVAQRLVRKLCGDKEKYLLSKEELEKLGHAVNLDFILEVLKRENAVDKGASWDKIPFYKPKVHGECEDGYGGRIGIHEVMHITSSLRELIMKDATSESIEKQARAEGMLTMTEDGIFKAVQGVTSIEEVLRVISE